MLSGRAAQTDQRRKGGGAGGALPRNKNAPSTSRVMRRHGEADPALDLRTLIAAPMHVDQAVNNSRIGGQVLRLVSQTRLPGDAELDRLLNTRPANSTLQTLLD